MLHDKRDSPIEMVLMEQKLIEWLHKSEREKPHCGETTQHAPTQTPCNQLAAASHRDSHTRTDPAHTHRTISTATNGAPYTFPIMTSALALQSQHRNANPAPTR